MAYHAATLQLRQDVDQLRAQPAGYEVRGMAIAVPIAERGAFLHALELAMAGAFVNRDLDGPNQHRFFLANQKVFRLIIV